MMIMVLLLMAAASASSTNEAEKPSTATCKFPGAPGAIASNLTCAPLGAAFAPASVSVTAVNVRAGVYTDVTTFSYSDAPATWPDAPNSHLPGRRTKVAAADIRDWRQPCCAADGTCTCGAGPQGGGGLASITIANNIKKAMAIVDAAGAAGADVVQLPEEFKYSWVTTDHAECPHSGAPVPAIHTSDHKAASR
jgi:hypothetical protein